MRYHITWTNRHGIDQFWFLSDYHEARRFAIETAKKNLLIPVTVSCVEDTGLLYPEIVGQWVIVDGLQASMEGKIK